MKTINASLVGPVRRRRNVAVLGPTTSERSAAKASVAMTLTTGTSCEGPTVIRTGADQLVVPRSSVARMVSTFWPGGTCDQVSENCWRWPGGGSTMNLMG